MPYCWKCGARLNDEDKFCSICGVATRALIGALLAPWLAALGAIAALATKCKIVVERRE